MPNIDGIDDFEGDSYHTYYWPHEEVDLANRRVAVIGTGATAIQVSGEIADKVGDLKIFQRRANWAAPLNNYKIDDAKMAELRARYEEIQADCAMSPGGFEHQPTVADLGKWAEKSGSNCGPLVRHRLRHLAAEFP